MKNRYCYWSVVDGEYVAMIQAAIQSARNVGVFKDFHVWSDSPVKGAITHQLAHLDKTNYLFKLRFLEESVKHLEYEYFVWLDADTYFVRNPGNILKLLRGSPVHASLESDACANGNTRLDWWGCPLDIYASLMREKGVFGRSIYNVNAGFWTVHRDVIDTFCSLAFDFWQFANERGFTFTEEAPIAYAVQMLCGNSRAHLLRDTANVWASDWTGCFLDRIPDGSPWTFIDYFSNEPFTVNPAIVHAMRSKHALIDATKFDFIHFWETKFVNTGRF